MKIYSKLISKVCNPEILFSAWDEFKRGKSKKIDVINFEYNLEQNIFDLFRDLSNKTYKHRPYDGFYVYDPKRRHIHKASVRDRVLHHAIFNIINPIYEPTFIATSFSCRIGKGTHKGVDALDGMIRKVSLNYTRPCFALKCDVRKFFDSVDQNILISILKRKIRDQDFLWLLEEIIGSFSSNQSDLFNQKGLPIGNLTSQIFANIYMNEFDQFVKNELKARYYVRYTDDFVILSHNEDELKPTLARIETFLKNHLQLSLHPEKITIRKYRQGIDFLGYVVFSNFKLLRARTRRRIVRKLKMKISECRNGNISDEQLNQTIQSFLGVMSHANSNKLQKNLLNHVWFWLKA
jgi:retron-type reverse transcriptase